MKKSQEEIHQLVHLLENEKTILPEFTIFGSNNWKEIDIQIECLKGIHTEDDIYDMEETEDDINVHNIVNIFNWMNGEIDNNEIVDDFEEKVTNISPIKVCKVPCSECPFRKNSIKGYLGPHTIDDIKMIARTGVDFKCHKTLELSEDRYRTCSGYVHYLNNTIQLSRNAEIAKLQKEFKGKENDCLGFDFEKYHTI